MQVARELAASVTFVRDPVMRGEVMNKISARLAMRLADFETLVKPGQPFRQGDAKVGRTDSCSIARRCDALSARAAR